MFTKSYATESPIRVAIDVRPLSGPPCGYTIYLESILKCLRGSEFELTLLSNKPLRSSYTNGIPLKLRIFGSIGDVKWEQRDLVEHLKNVHYDVYFTGANRGIPWRKRRDTRYVLGLLDVIPFIFFKQYYWNRLGAWLTDAHLNRETAAQLIALARADAILTISRQSAEDIRRIFKRRDVTAHAIRLANVEPAAPKPPLPRFAYVGGIDVRKKVDVLLKAFVQFRSYYPDHQLVLIGSDFSTLKPMIADLGLANSVELTGYVDHDTKFKILRESLAMIYPSLYEGYGLAIAEGFQAGIPVVAGGGGAQDEVGGSGTRRIDPTSPDDIASAMIEMLEPANRDQWIMRGQKQLQMLSAPAIERDTADYFLKQGLIGRRA